MYTAYAVPLQGNRKAFSAGFDLKIMAGKQSMDQHTLFLRGCELAIRLASTPLQRTIAVLILTAHMAYHYSKPQFVELN